MSVLFLGIISVKFCSLVQHKDGDTNNMTPVNRQVPSIRLLIFIKHIRTVNCKREQFFPSVNLVLYSPIATVSASLLKNVFKAATNSLGHIEYRETLSEFHLHNFICIIFENTFEKDIC